MKKRTHPLIPGSIVVGLLAAAAPTFAADPIVSHDNSKAWRTETVASDRSLGHVERANKLIGREVLTSDNQRFGKIDNIVVDLDSGRILYAVIGSGGFLGAGEHRFAVPPAIFTQVSADNSAIQLKVDKQKLMSAPKFATENDQDAELGQAAYVSQIYQYFGQKAWWQGATAANVGAFHNVHEVSDLIGMRIENVNNEKVGKIENVALDLPMGRAVYVVLLPDSSLNLGDELYALPPNALTWNSSQKCLISDLNKDKLAAAPHFENNNWASLSDPAWAAQVYKYYGKQPYFRNSGLEPTGRQ